MLSIKSEWLMRFEWRHGPWSTRHPRNEEPVDCHHEEIPRTQNMRIQRYEAALKKHLSLRSSLFLGGPIKVNSLEELCRKTAYKLSTMRLGLKTQDMDP